MNSMKLTIALFAAAQIFAANLASAQTASTASAGPMPPFGKPNVSDILTRLLSLTDAQKTQLQPYVDAVQPQLEATHEQARQAEDNLLQQLCATIRPLLSPQQQIKLDGFEALRAPGPPPPPPAPSHPLSY
jgi:Spy/CpxP family protein refolding chaperone